jgi:hypothetical protein
MKLLVKQTIQHGDAVREIELLQGNLAYLPPDHRVDLLVVSAFPNDYTATSTSLIGALNHVGLSVQALAADKQADLRQQYSCWLSKQIGPAYNFRHILCIESGWRGTPPEITDDLFRAIAPYLLTDFSDGSVAMPLIGAGDQGWPAEQMLLTILQAAVSWMERGLPLRLLKIVIYREDVALHMAQVFTSYMNEHRKAAAKPGAATEPVANPTYDLFLSYSLEEAEVADYFVQKLREFSGSTLMIFHDKTSLREGSTWLMSIADALDASRRVAAFYSPAYWISKNCQMEFLAAFTRQVDTGEDILFPIYLSDAKLPYMFRTVQFSDCRVNDRAKLAVACSRLAADLG